MTLPETSGLKSVLKKHGIEGEPVHIATGYINWVYEVDGQIILRVSRGDRDPEDAYTEAVAVPAAREAGILTPDLIAFDDSREFIDSVVTIYERAPGDSLANVRVDQHELPGLYRRLGQEVRRLHEGVRQVDDPNGWLDRPYFCDPRKEIERARTELKVELVTYDWIAKWNERLAPALDAPGEERFLHNDLHAGNTMVLQSPLRLSAIIDWGDACWGDPVLDFERVPVWAAPWALEAYGERDEQFVGRLLAHVLGTTLNKACDPEFEPTDQPWHPLPSAFLFNLVRLMRMDLPQEWHRWLPDSPV